MAWKDLPYLAAAAFAAILFRLYSRGGDQARSMEESASGNDGTAGGASSTDASTEGQDLATSSGYDYEVFLSFRGPDTRAAFTDFLYTRLDDAGIRTFKDDEELRIGEKFAPELLQAINQSKISVPIFSKGYASSVWCLKELVQMVECWKNGRQKIMPIFYDVAPSEVRHQIEGYAKAFRSHEEKQRYSEDTIREWKTALSAVGGINGWDLHSKTDRREGEFAREVTQKVFTELKKAYLAVSECLVSVDNHVNAIMEMIGTGTSETRIIGIHGMGGIGKTTTAKMIYNKLSDGFDKCCFLQDIRETSKGNGIQYLQAQLIFDILRMNRVDIKDIHEGTRMIKDRLSNKRVLLLLDDVEKVNHIDAFVGNRDWFGRGSKIIITTRNEDILHVPIVDQRYKVECMDRDQSLQLFSKHAFRRDYPLGEDMVQSNRAICIAGGLPLALEVIGSLLCCIEKKKWDGKLKVLENIPHEDVLSKLKISYEALRDHEQCIFLDIACLFIGYEKDVVIYFWDESRFFPKEAMDVLENMSLMKINGNNKVWMHDQVRDLGREIVHRQSERKIEKQSRVWDYKKALDLLRRPKEGKKEVEALRLKFDREEQFRFTYEDFKSLSNLRFLQVDGSAEYFDAEKRLFWHESPLNVLPTNVFPENSNLLPNLRWLSWHDIPITFKITNFYMKHVVILDLSSSGITHNWQGWSHMKVMKNLKVLDLSHCQRLKRSPNFSAHSNLERLILIDCRNLVEIDKSICQLKSLVFLDVASCSNLRRLPNEMGRDLASLIELNISNTKIKELPDSIIRKWKNLKVLSMIGTPIRKIPNALWMMENLEKLEFDAEESEFAAEETEFEAKDDFDVEIDNCIYKNRCLRILDLGNVRICEVPRLPESLIELYLYTLYMDTFPDLSNLVNLKELWVGFGPRNDGGESGGPAEAYPMPRGIENSSKLESLNPRSDYVTLPVDLSSIHPRLESLVLKGADLRCLPRLPSTLSTLFLDSKDATTLTTDVISLLPQPKKLLLRCPNLRCLPSLPSNLLSLQLESECVAALPTDMSSLLPRLKELWLECPKLSCLPSLPLSLSKLRLKLCKSLSSLGDLSNLKGLSRLHISHCAIFEIRGLDPLENLGELWLAGFQQVETFPSIGNFNRLKSLYVYDCGNLVEIQGELPQSLEKLVIYGCGSLEELPGLSRLKGLKMVEIKRCGNLDVEAISSLCWEKSVVFWGEDSDDQSESEQEDDEFESESQSEGEGDEYEEEEDDE